MSLQDALGFIRVFKSAMAGSDSYAKVSVPVEAIQTLVRHEATRRSGEGYTNEHLQGILLCSL
jgi:hypothetical protein